MPRSKEKRDTPRSAHGGGSTTREGPPVRPEPEEQLEPANQEESSEWWRGDKGSGEVH
ncbi:MAG TPA: hypothetical protein VMT00_12905 [Thermoanaerobaculia bacterium]|nr:hypothetical protein [Thermoanaerobaculia bacterium]